jgi:hypothetical protein
VRGNIPAHEFLIDAIAVGVWHMQEELILRQRTRVYDRLANRTNNYAKAIESIELQPVEERSTPIPNALCRTLRDRELCLEPRTESAFVVGSCALDATRNTRVTPPSNTKLLLSFPPRLI